MFALNILAVVFVRYKILLFLVAVAFNFISISCDQFSFCTDPK